MATWLSASGLRAVIWQAITTHSKDLTALLQEAKNKLGVAFADWIRSLGEIPNSISRDGPFFNEHIRNKEFKTIIAKFINDRRLEKFRQALRTPKGNKLLLRVIRNRLWEFIRGRFKKIQNIGLNDNNDYSNDDGDDNDAEMDLEICQFSSSDDTDNDQPAMLRKASARQAVNSNRSRPKPVSSGRGPNNNTPPSSPRNTGTAVHDDEKPRVVPRPGAKKGFARRGRNNNTPASPAQSDPYCTTPPLEDTPPASPRAHVASNTNVRTPPLNTPKRSSTPAATPQTNRAEKPVYPVTAATSAEFEFDVCNREQLQLDNGDRIFVPAAKNKCSTPSLLAAYNLAGAMEVSGSVFKSILLLSSTQRTELVFVAEGDEFFAVAAPYLDHKIRFYAVLIDLSTKYQTLLGLVAVKRRFRIFVCMLAVRAFEVNNSKRFNPALQAFGLNPAGLTAAKLIQQLAKLDFEELINGCYEFIRTMISIYELQMAPSFTLTTREIDLLEEAQSSRDDYERIIFHLGINLLAPIGCSNNIVNTLALFEAIVCGVENETAKFPQFKELKSKIEKQI